jgi:two-component system cell cycle response regulator
MMGAGGTIVVGQNKPEASAEFLATFGDDGTDIVETAAPSLGGLRLERQFILTVLAGPQIGVSRAIDQGEIVLGRGEGCSMLLHDPGLSRQHCRVIKDGDRVTIEDLGSSNGTFVDGEIVSAERALPEGARIHVGRHTMLSLSRQDPLERHAAQQIYESSMRDPLTELHNRRFFDQRLREEYAFATRHQRPLSVIILDLDHFKRVNDSYGHPAGDEVLRQVARLVKRCVRQEDVACRLGGEEFGVIVRSDCREGARALAERMRRRLEDTPVYFGEHIILVTTSGGIATAAPPHMHESPAALLAAADQALYRAKAQGRNRCDQ